MSKKLTHCLVLPYPAIGHINPMLQFSKRLENKGVKATLVLTKSILNTVDLSSISVSVETISDGFDDGGSKAAQSYEAYLEKFKQVGSETLSSVVERLSGRNAVDCIVADAFLPWSVDVAERFGLVGALFFTQSCAVNSIYYHAFKGLLEFPVSVGSTTTAVVSVPEVAQLRPSDLPSFLYDPESDPVIAKMLLDQFSVVHKAHWLLCNTYYELEQQVVNWMMNIMPIRTIGPLIPSMYLDKRIDGDNQYGLTLSSPNLECMNWLNSCQKHSVVYVSFGSYIAVEAEQIREVAFGLKKSECHFVWVVRTSEADKLPKGFVEETSEKGLVVSWCPQLEVLANDAIGCFVTHCGWNSTLEALSLGVPMVAIPQWSDQSTNAKYVVDVWKVGIKAERDEKGFVRQEEVQRCVNEMINGERGKEIRIEATKFRVFAKTAVDVGGTSDNNIDEFIAHLG